MIVKLDRDCLWQIFANLEHDKKSLHSTILVNRIWCEIAIQFLWKKPFRYLYTCPKACGCVAEKDKRRLEIFFQHLSLVWLIIKRLPELIFKIL
jgi:hypothetical protein